MEIVRVSLEHPYRSIYLDQQFHSRLQSPRRQRPQAYRVSRTETWASRLLAVALLTALACSVLFGILLVLAVAWGIGLVAQEILRWWRG